MPRWAILSEFWECFAAKEAAAFRWLLILRAQLKLTGTFQNCSLIALNLLQKNQKLRGIEEGTVFSSPD